MAELVDLVIADGLVGHEAHHMLDVVHTGGHDGDARAGEGHLGGGGVLEDHVRIPRLTAEGEDVREGHIVPLKLVDAVGVIPHDHEVGGGRLQAGDAVDGFRAVNDPLRVGVLGDAPDALYGRVLDSGLHRVHVGAGCGHGNGNQLHAEGFGHVKMPVITRGRAQEFYRVQLAPGLLAVEQAVGVRLSDGVVHQGQAGVAADKALLGPATQNLREILLRAGQAGELAVVADVETRLHAVLRLAEYGQHIADQIKLLLPRLAPGHVQLQAPALQLRKPLRYRRVFSLQLGGGYFAVFHSHPSPFLPQCGYVLIFCQRPWAWRPSSAAPIIPASLPSLAFASRVCLSASRPKQSSRTIR